MKPSIIAWISNSMNNSNYIFWKSNSNQFTVLYQFIIECINFLYFKMGEGRNVVTRTLQRVFLFLKMAWNRKRLLSIDKRVAKNVDLRRQINGKSKSMFWNAIDQWGNSSWLCYSNENWNTWCMFENMSRIATVKCCRNCRAIDSRNSKHSAVY